ncbi:helix-hairpin-helix domain-containing protein [Maribacter aquimaris]|nr:helix-hairpin-helix domain-containing protein [Maribacter aquimaris]
MKSHFSFSKQEKSGIFFLLLIIVVLQVVFYLVKNASHTLEPSLTIDWETQVKLDSLKLAGLQKDSPRLFPFNPNYISDFKGYTLGMTPEEIDRLHAYRKKNLYVNSVGEFQKITGISDSLLKRIAPYFKFPEWVNKNTARKTVSRTPAIVVNKNNPHRIVGEIEVKDLNSVTANELKSIYGIGDKLSQRIVKFRNRLGGFLVNEQLYDVYGLEPEVVERTLVRFQVLKRPDVEKININTASAKKLSKLVYIQKNVANRIINYRNDKGSIDSFDELLNIENFPIEKIDRIKLYLAL